MKLLLELLITGFIFAAIIGILHTVYLLCQ